MEDRVLLKIALCTSFVGLFLLLYFSHTFALPVVSIGSVDRSLLEKTVAVEGSASSLRLSQKVSSFTLRDESGFISVVSFDYLEIRNGDFVSVEGKVGEYKGKLQIVADEIAILKNNHSNI